MEQTMASAPTEDVEDVGQLVAAARSGDARAWRKLVDLYSGMLHRRCLSYRLSSEDARDVVQTTWLLAVQHLPRLRNDEHVGGWLAAIANRECLKLLRRARRETAWGDISALDRPDAHTPSLEREVARSWLTQLLPELVCRLPAPQRVLLEALMAVPGTPYVDVARMTGRPLGSIGPARARCLARLRSMLTQREVDAAFLN
jgi:RNA polymerase sigma factor (sigma-70 family)